MDKSNRAQNIERMIFDNRTVALHPRYVCSHELAQILGVSVHAIRKWRSQGKIVPKKFGRSVRYVVDEVVATLTQKGRSYAK